MIILLGITSVLICHMQAFSTFNRCIWTVFSVIIVILIFISVIIIIMFLPSCRRKLGGHLLRCSISRHKLHLLGNVFNVWGDNLWCLLKVERIKLLAILDIYRISHHYYLSYALELELVLVSNSNKLAEDITPQKDNFKNNGQIRGRIKVIGYYWWLPCILSHLDGVGVESVSCG